MNLLNAALIALGIFAILRLPTLHVAKNAWVKHDLLTKRKKGFWIAVIEQAGAVMLSAGLTFLMLAAFLLYINSQGGASVEKMNHALDRLEALREPLKLAKDIWGGWLLFFSLVVFVYLWFRSGKKHFVDKLVAQSQEKYKELERILEERPQDWEKLEPTPVMKAVLGKLQRTSVDLEALRPEEPQYSFRLAKLEENRDRLAGMLVQLDFERRIEIPWDLDVPKAATRWARFRNVILSQGFISDMKGLGRVFMYGVLALTSAGLVGIQSSSLAGAVETKIVRLDDLTVSRSSEESAKKRQTAEKLGRSEEGSSLLQASPTPQQQAALRAFSHQAVHNFARNPVWAEVPRQATATSEQARQEMVRLAILENVNPGGATAQDEHAMQEAAFRAYSEETAGPDRPTAAENAVYEEITAHPTVHRRKFWAAVEDWYVHKRATYREPVSAEELQATFVENAFGSFVPGAEGNGEFTAQFSEILKEGVQTAGKNAFETFRNIIALRALNGDDPEEILNALGKRDPHIAYMTRAASKAAKSKLSIFNEQVKSEADFVNIAERHVVRTANQTEDNSAAMEVLKSLPEEIRKGREVEFADLLSGYGSEFPIRAAPVSTFAREKVLASWGISNANDAGIRLARSTDFERLQSYSRVGGILFGRKPDSGTLDVPGFWWEKKNGTLSLYLQKRDSTPIAGGIYEPYLVWQALAYAADQRPTVVTLLLTPDIGRKQVMVHPAFRDTGLGCRLIAADQWIFHYADPDPSNPKSSQVRRMINRYSVESAIYVRAWEALNDPEKKGGVAGERLKPMLQSVEFPSIESAPGIEPDLLRLATRCATTQGNAFDDCIRAGADGTSWKARLPEKKPRIRFVSQIREAQYNVDGGLAFMQAPLATAASAPPLEMTVQMTIDDNNHWQFPRFDAKSVLMPLRKDKSKDLQEMQQLAALQRLFRVALSGGFGPVFPIEKLVELSELARNMDHSQKRTTPRWLKEQGDDKPIEYGLAEDMRHHLNGHGPGVTEELEQTTASHVRPLLQACSDTLSLSNVEAIPSETLNSRCQWSDMRAPVLEDCRTAKAAGKNLDTVEACHVFALAMYGERTVIPLHNLRLSLGAAVADRAADLACPTVP